MTDNIKHMFFYRLVDGKEVKYDFTVDVSNGRMLITDEKPVETPTQDAIISHFKSRQIKMLEERGITYVVNPDGGIDITGVPDKEVKLTSFFSDETPCWFPECETLRARYKLEEQQLKDSKDCRDCDLGELIRKYRDKLEQILHGSPKV